MDGFLRTADRGRSSEYGDLEDSGSVERWKSRLAKLTGYHGVGRLQRYLEYLIEHEPEFKGLSPDRLVEFQQNAHQMERYKILDTVQRWIDSLTELRANSKKDYFETKIEVPLIRYGKRQRIETLINEEALLLAKYIRNESSEWTPRIT